MPNDSLKMIFLIIFCDIDDAITLARKAVLLGAARAPQ
jgi:hypothetical protein